MYIKPVKWVSVRSAVTTVLIARRLRLGSTWVLKANTSNRVQWRQTSNQFSPVTMLISRCCMVDIQEWLYIFWDCWSSGNTFDWTLLEATAPKWGGEYREERGSEVSAQQPEREQCACYEGTGCCCHHIARQQPTHHWGSEERWRTMKQSWYARALHRTEGRELPELQSGWSQTTFQSLMSSYLQLLSVPLSSINYVEREDKL